MPGFSATTGTPTPAGSHGLVRRLPLRTHTGGPRQVSLVYILNLPSVPPPRTLPCPHHRTRRSVHAWWASIDVCSCFVPSGRASPSPCGPRGDFEVCPAPRMGGDPSLDVDFAMGSPAHHSTRPYRVRFRCRLDVRFRLLPTSARADAVTFRFRYVYLVWTFTSLIENVVRRTTPVSSTDG